MKNSIRFIWQLYPTYLLITLISLGAAIWYISGFSKDRFMANTAANLETQAKIAASQITPLLNPPNHAAIDQICKQIGKNTDTRITIIHPDGSVIGDSDKNPAGMDSHADRPEIRTAVSGSRGVSVRHSASLNQTMMYVAQPEYDSDKLIAIVRTSVPIDAIDQELADIHSRIILGGFAIALLASVICLYVSRRISQPMENMIKSAEKFAQGNLDHRMEASGPRETRALAKAMNLMAAKLKERMEAEINQRNQTEAILTSMAEGVIALDMEDNILSVNAAASRMFEGLRTDTPNKHIRESIRNVDLWDFIEASKQNQNTEGRDIVLHNQGERILNVHASPMLNLDGEKIGSLLVAADVTQLRKLEKIRSDFVANVSHEIKTPLTAIKGYVEALWDGAKDHPDELEKFLTIIEKHTNRLEAIIEDLLHLSRIERENGQRQIQLVRDSVAAAARSAIDECMANASAKQIDIEMACDNDFEALINADLLRQAIFNLIDNAIKYSGEGGEITIEITQDADTVNISVQDNGIGISKIDQSRIFERFYRVDKARSNALGGTGLGLAITKHIVQAHGGKITVNSIQGKGSEFMIALPLLAAV